MGFFLAFLVTELQETLLKSSVEVEYVVEVVVVAAALSVWEVIEGTGEAGSDQARGGDTIGGRQGHGKKMRFLRI